MAFLIPSIQLFFGLPCALFCFGIHFNAILGNLPSAILWTWPYHVSWFCSISFIIGSSNLTFSNVALVCQNNYGLSCTRASRWMRGAILLRKHPEILGPANWGALLDNSTDPTFIISLRVYRETCLWSFPLLRRIVLQEVIAVSQ